MTNENKITTIHHLKQLAERITEIIEELNRLEGITDIDCEEITANNGE